jgi:hypothetical protein
MYLNRDAGINHIKARKDRRCYGPGFPGDVRNASAYPFPIQYEIVEDVDIPRLVYEEDKSPCLAPIQRAAKKLEKMGCRAIAAECGYFAYFQKEIAGHVEIPVFMSSLLQAPWAQQLIGPQKVVGIQAALKKYMTPHHLEAVGVKPGSNYVLGGAMDDGQCEEFENLWVASSLSIFTKSIRIWALWCWNAPVSNRLRVLFSGKLTSLSSVGVHCWIMPMR